jgi:hypothetical protein
MRTWMRSKVRLLFITCAVLLAIPAIALADNVVNDVTAGGSDTITAGGSTTINYKVNGTGGDGQSGCNASDGSSATVNLSVPANVTASKTSLTFTACNVFQSVTFSSNTAGDYPISVSSISDSGTGTYKNEANFTLHVNAPPPPPNDPPTISVPGPQTVEATSSNGAVVNYTATASDPEDGSLTPTCTPASGSTFPLGTTRVNCSVTDSGGLEDSGFFDVTVVDTTDPTLNLPGNITEEATGPGGAAVSFSATADDAVDSDVQVNCTPASGSTFQLGTTTVDCTATDDFGNTSSGSFTVTVEDTTAPSLNLPGNQTVEATGPGGATVTYTADADDLVDGNIAADCTPASGATFPLGTTTVECSATDAAGNTANGTFDVTVEDTTAPTLDSHADVSATATTSAGAVVNYTKPSATDAVDSNPTVTCSPAPGATFPIGTTTVSCTAEDASGNVSAAKTFKVNVSVSWSNFLQPINVPPATQSIFKMGSTVPVKFNLTGASSGITNGTFYLKYAYTGIGDNNGEMESVATTTGTTGTQFRYSEGQYIYNWSTKGVVTKPGNYELRVYTDANGTNLLGKVSIELKK